jgi:hypothetical protein
MNASGGRALRPDQSIKVRQHTRFVTIANRTTKPPPMQPSSSPAPSCCTSRGTDHRVVNAERDVVDCSLAGHAQSSWRVGRSETLLQRNPMARSLCRVSATRTVPSKFMAAGRHTVVGELVGACTHDEARYRSRRPHAKIRLVVSHAANRRG